MSLSGVFGGVIFVEPSSSVAEEDLLILLSVPSSIPESCLLFKLKGSCVNGLPKTNIISLIQIYKDNYNQIIKIFKMLNFIIKFISVKLLRFDELTLQRF